MTDLISREALLKDLLLDLLIKGELNYDEVKDLITNAPAIKKDKQVSSFAWALIMETAASFEVASYSISDADAKKSAEGAIKYARDTANKYYTTPQQPQEKDEIVNKAFADALEEAAKICDELAEQDYCVDVRVASEAIRALIKRNAKEG